MDLLLWRHAEALDGEPDHKRPLSARGKRQAKRVARWLREHQPRNLRVLTSPAVRTTTTAAAFSKHHTVLLELGLGYSAQEALAAIGWPDVHDPVLLVGHQPQLGELAALLLTGKPYPLTIRKGALWWFSRRERDGQTQLFLRTVVTPEML
ncbi:MAG: histidine phosphatase family protein [Rhodocyclaceae bacterium]|nr:histidine phosphatase family protein [Rhodocyclaceae bacterium]